MLIALLCLVVAGFLFVFGINCYVKGSTSSRILTTNEVTERYDCILVLGCHVREDGNPSPMLRDRITRGIELYRVGAAPKLLMSGDHGREGYDEVNTMKAYAMEADIPSADIFMDHAGFSTYESIYRAKEIFEAKRMLIVSQEYHLYRALYIADKLGLEAVGVASDYRTYVGQSGRELREILARCKDFVNSIIKPEPTYLGEIISIHGSGDATND